eukprot:gene7522-9245_t
MKANASTREKLLLKDTYELYKWQLENNKGPNWVFHDGPPYANGDLHMGHALNKILKDMVNRYKMLRGYRVNYIPGWDCHGLPIEQKSFEGVKNKDKMTPSEIRKRCTDYANKEIIKQKEGFKSLGVMGDWEEPYKTMEPRYEVSQLETFYDMYKKGFVYRGIKPVHWSPSSRTALAEAELEYNDNHVSKSIFVKFKIQDLPTGLKSRFSSVDNLFAVIWTTTPWTIPANLAISVNPEMNYVLVSGNGSERLIISQERLDTLRKSFSMDLTVLDSFKGSELAGTVATHPQFGRPSPILLGDHVVEGSGTGLVHTAPGHGVEDFLICKSQRPDIKVISPVDDDGKFTSEVGEKFQGLEVLGKGNEAVIQDLESLGALLLKEDYVHKYPYDWRTKKPIIIRTTKQWFVELKDLTKPVLERIPGINFVPPSGTNRLSSMIGHRSDWCISRQRYWGVPIPVFYHPETLEPLINDETISHQIELFKKHGSDCWFNMDNKELLPSKYHNIDYIKGMDTMDVWFDSGTSWRGVLVQRGIIPMDGSADIYLEGSDQHRGWFQSSILTSVCARGVEPYKNVLTHGFTLDEKGQKMSKSLGNTMVPSLIINGGSNQKLQPAYGVDLLRTWVASTDYTKDVSIGPNILGKLLENIKKLRNTLRFMLASNFDFNPTLHSVPYNELSQLDQYALHKLFNLHQNVVKNYDNFNFQKVYADLLTFCNEISAFYFDVVKQRLYVENPNSKKRRSTQTVLFNILEIMNKSLAPILVHTTEDVYQHQYQFRKPTDSVFNQGWTLPLNEWENEEIFNKFNQICSVRDSVNRLLQNMRDNGVMGRPDEAKLVIKVTKSLYDVLISNQAQLNDIFCVSGVKLELDENQYTPKAQDYEYTPVNKINDQEFSVSDYLSIDFNYIGKCTINARLSDQHKCPRCWRHQSEAKDTVCGPCNTILESLK